jgi:hypothetical protein
MYLEETLRLAQVNPVYRCPVCHSADIRISAVIDCTVSPNDPQDPVEDFAMLEAYATWETQSDAWCESCHWQGLAGRLEESTADSAS